MAGTLTVQNIQGPSSGANANKIIIPAGQTLDASAGVLTPSAGQVVQTAYAEKREAQGGASWTISSGAPQLYGTNIGNRSYVIAEEITITKRHPDSYFMCWGYTGFTSYTSLVTQAHGIIITLDDVQAIDMMDYPYYSEADFANVDNMYKPPISVQGVFQTGSGISTHTIRLRPFGYVEGTNTGVMSYRGSSLFVQEIAG